MYVFVVYISSPFFTLEDRTFFMLLYVRNGSMKNLILCSYEIS
jgi:hypothetical protein